MKCRLSVLTFLALMIAALIALSPWAGSVPIFSEDFSSGNFANWTRTFTGPGSSQSVSGGVAHFIVPPPTAGTLTYSYLAKDGFTSTVNSTIIAEQNVLISKVPSGCVQGNGAVFFFYVCDSTDLGGNNGNFGVGIDGSGVWSLWIGGNTVYTYVFQADGNRPASNTWYHITLTISNSAGTVTLAVDGTVVVSATQQQFTDKTHLLSLMSGIGEDWWSDCVGQEEVAVSNVRLDISDAATSVTPNPTAQAPSNPTPITGTNPAPTPASTHLPTPTNPTPTTSSSTPTPHVPSPTPTQVSTIQQEAFPYWLLLGLTITLALCVELLFMLRKR
jgi:hypothetical protein